MGNKESVVDEAWEKFLNVMGHQWKGEELKLVRRCFYAGMMEMYKLNARSIKKPWPMVVREFDEIRLALREHSKREIIVDLEDLEKAGIIKKKDK